MVFIFGLDVLTLGKLSLGFQSAAFALLIAGFFFAKFEKDFRRHRMAMLAATGTNLISLLFVMLLALPAIIFSPAVTDIMKVFIYAHHLIGLIAIVMAVTLAVKSCDWVDRYVGKRKFMLALISLWSAAYVAGILVYMILYV
jgi:uncharacterized membrane protein YozB (DUF420 family)